MKKNFETLKFTAIINLYSLFKIPLLTFCLPRFVQMDQEKTIVKIPLGYRTKNHLNVMYFGALAMGAELSIAATAVKTIQESGKRIDFLFKDFKAEFLKRADGDVHFVCEQSSAVKDLITHSLTTTDRLESKFTGYAFVPSKSNEPVMKYELTLSVKNRSF